MENRVSVAESRPSAVQEGHRIQTVPGTLSLKKSTLSKNMKADTVGYATTNTGCYNERGYNEQFLSIKSGCYNERYYNEKFLSIKSGCYNERCYNERMLQRTVFVNKIRML